MVRRTIWALSILPFLTGACSSIRVTTDYDRKADYAALKTYNWAEPDKNQRTDPRIDWQFVDAPVRRAANQELVAKGYTLAGTGQPDFTLVYYVVLENRVEPVESVLPARYPMYGYQYTVSGNISWVLASPGQTRQYTQGSLMLDIVDARTNQALWRGTATARLIGKRTPEEREHGSMKPSKNCYRSFHLRAKSCGGFGSS